jgi:hypothetical protein
VNESRDTRDLEQVYGRMITESDDSKVWKSGDCPEALGDSEHATGLAPEENRPVEATQEPLKPEDAGEDNAYYMKKISERLDKKDKKPGKNLKEGINNSRTMSKKDPTNIFDKLYSTIMEGDDPFADLNGMGSDDDFGGEDEFGGEEEMGGDEVTLSLPRELAEQLCDALKAELEGGDELEDLEDEESMGDDMDDEMLGDAVVSKPEPTAASDGVPGLTGKNNKTSGSGYSADGGSAEGGNIKEDPTPKPLGGHGDRDHPHAGKVGSGSNKVNNPKTKALGD